METTDWKRKKKKKENNFCLTVKVQNKLVDLV